jgi:hypothetical protein
VGVVSHGLSCQKLDSSEPWDEGAKQIGEEFWLQAITQRLCLVNLGSQARGDRHRDCVPFAGWFSLELHLAKALMPEQSPNCCTESGDRRTSWANALMQLLGRIRFSREFEHFDGYLPDLP